MQKPAVLLLIKATTTVNAMRIQMLYANGATLRSLCTSPTFLPTLRNSGSNALRPRMRKFQVGLGQPLQPLPDRWMFCVSLLVQKLHRPQLRIWGVAFRLIRLLPPSLSVDYAEKHDQVKNYLISRIEKNQNF